MDRIVPLNDNQIEELLKFELSTKHKPFRILAKGMAVNLSTGILSDKGSNILYHPVYWDRPKEFAKKAKEFLEQNNPNITFKIIYH